MAALREVLDISEWDDPIEELIRLRENKFTFEEQYLQRWRKKNGFSIEVVNKLQKILSPNI